MDDATYELTVVGWVQSPLVDRSSAPRQGAEGAPPASLVFRPEMRPALADLQPGQEVLVLTWLHQARRDVLSVHPRDDMARPLTGVFATRSSERPNPIGLHRVVITAIDGEVVGVDKLEAIDGTPVLDVKPVLGKVFER
jgi:tRNA-Thr(GGU) m(6)t(6)A37 methyltransferase TsaA